ncbi:hypothetical protein NQZ79_g2501 [Umbelopsis isabellina]|nr:hypothetical protein NQZ79_g2501 [Umbelopsis isabellina]
MSLHKWPILLLLGAFSWAAAQDTTGQCTYGPGYYCGTSIGKEAGQLYYCEDGVYTNNQTCQFGCNSSKPGYPDYCYQSLNVTTPPQDFAVAPLSSSMQIGPSSTPTPSDGNTGSSGSSTPLSPSTPSSSSSTPSSTSLPVTSPTPSANLTHVWEEAIDSFISHVTSNHTNEHMDAVMGNMHEIVEIARHSNSRR